MADPAEPFAPIMLGPEHSMIGYDVALRLANVPTLTELTARLGALPRAALEAATVAEPQIYGRMISDARDNAAYLRDLAAAFSKLADRLTEVGGK